MKWGTGIFLAGLILAGAAPAVRGQTPSGPRLADERILLRTSRGDLVVALFPEVAPRHVAQLTKLVRMGVYDSTWFHRVEPGFVVQLTDAQNRRLPLGPEERAAIQKLPLELSPVPHTRGVASMARQDADLNSAETSFSLLLAPAPHLDGKYTVFGKLEYGEDVLQAIAEAPRDPQNRPLQEILVQTAVIKTGVEVEKMRQAGELRQAIPYAGQATGPSKVASASMVVVAGIAVMMFLSLLGFLLAGHLQPQQVSAFSLLTVLVGGFLLMRELVPRFRGHAILATALFAGMVALFKLMNRFESGPRPRPAPPKPDPAASGREGNRG